ncbi:unnamed protein product [Adineta steineri]|uniref:Uncharacterized protein n=1 Tax=Adineta steineri TaxID=433720 RepID=A0A819PTR6_9BILA|nr:unnamed protein product [Adineta steineri]
MATENNKTQCSVCNKENNTYNCKKCSNEFCLPHFTEHRQRIEAQLEAIINDHDQFQQTIIQQKRNPHNSSLIEQINQWETNSIEKIQQTAQQCRETLMKLTQKLINNVERQFIELSKKLKEIRQKNEFNEIDLNNFQLKLTQITEEFVQPSNISIRQDSQEFIKKISVISSFESYHPIQFTISTATIPKNPITTSQISTQSQVKQKPVQTKKSKFKQSAITVAGGNAQGRKLNQLRYPWGIFVDNDKSICIADCYNHRIVKWKLNSNKGRVIVDGNQNNQLNLPTNIISDKKNNSFIISDQGNRRVIRYFHQNQEILISNIDCYGLTIDKNGFIYVSDYEYHEVRRWKQGDKIGELIAGGNGQGNQLNQLNSPTYIFIAEDYSLYILDHNNHRVMKWKKDAKEGIIVAGGNGQGNSLRQLSYPQGVFVDHLDQIYVTDYRNDRVMRWCEGDEAGEIVVGGNGQGNQSNQLNGPAGLSFDDEGNLYVVDHNNHRIQKYEKVLI